MGADSMEAQPSVSYDDEVAILHLGGGENRLNAESIAAIEACLDEVEASTSQALVTAASGKIWSNGMDTAWMADRPDRAAETLVAAERLLARILSFPIATVAALQGHTFAGGLLLALAHDQRVMRADRGFLCLPEANFDAVFSRGMADLLQARMGEPVAARAAILAERYDAATALRLGLVDEIAEEAELSARAIAVARAATGRGRATIAGMKAVMHARPLASLGGEPPQALLDALLALGKQ
ncbi:MAG: enoyl-CoA hydratase/isomerase family protein [Sporichthyaceae bacterium]